jgi:membrane protease YdiL (CAAX protease family)
MIFAAAHFQPWFLLPLSVIGITLGLARVATGSIVATTLIHSAYNLGAILLDQWVGDEQDGSDATATALLMLAAAFGIFVVWRGLTRLQPAPGSMPLPDSPPRLDED